MQETFGNGKLVKPLSKCRDHIFLWKILNQQGTLKKMGFRQYVSIGTCTAEFCSKQFALIVEIEGFCDMINDPPEHRDIYLRNFGYKILRYESYLLHDFPEIIIDDIIMQSRKIRA